MGEVWLARDSSLNRDVAIKVLPHAVAADAQYMARFEREAQLLAALNHPNIATLYSLEKSGGTPALVMELVEGPTLLDRIKQGALPIDDAIEIARQICDALEAAHAKGIIHRDLKPSNIKLTPEGKVKILDFGLAKALEPESTPPTTADSPTMTLAMTRAGFVLGTAAYMSPEQARGLAADKRADIWAFGLVLYEMLTGHVTFGGETIADTLASVLKTSPDFNALPAETPPSIRRLLHRCLERDRKKRLHDIADARLELDAANESTPQASAPSRSSTNWLPWAIAGASAIGALALAVLLFRQPTTPEAQAARFDLLPPEGIGFAPSGHQVSPDGRLLLVRAGASGKAESYIRPIHSSSYRQLPGADSLTEPQFSRDSRAIVFRTAGFVKTLDLETGFTSTLCPANESLRGFSWNANNAILFGSNAGPVQRVSASGGAPSEVTKLNTSAGETGHGFPYFLPDGRFFLYTSFSADAYHVMVADSEGKESPRRLFPMKGGAAVFAASADLKNGILLYRDGSALVGRAFDAETRAVTSGQFAVGENLANTQRGVLPVSVSIPARVMLWNSQPASGAGAGLETILLDRAAKRLATLSTGAEPFWNHPELSSDGTRLLGDRSGRGRDGSPDATRDLWSLDLRRNVASPITFDPGSESPAAFSADGSRIFYAYAGTTQREGSGIYTAPSDGSGIPLLIRKGAFHHLAPTPDGKQLAVETTNVGLGTDILIVSVDEPQKPAVPIGGVSRKSWPQFSPNGKWIAFASEESGRSEIYVQSHPPGNGKWRVSRDGGRLARWKSDGKELVFHEGEGKFLSVEVREQNGKLEFSSPRRLFQVAMDPRPILQYFAMTPDAQRFVLNVPAAQTQSQGPRVHPLTVELDWMARLKR